MSLKTKREFAVSSILEGDEIEEVASQLCVSERTVFRWLRHYREHGTTTPTSTGRRGRPFKLTPENLDVLRLHLPSVGCTSETLRNEVRSRFSVKVSTQTSYRIAKKIGLQLFKRELPRWRQQILDGVAKKKSICVVVGLSGGKDSTAVTLLARKHLSKHNIQVRYLFADTGSELPETYSFLNELESKLGISVERIVSKAGLLEDVIKKKFNFYLPSPSSRYCTRISKIQPFRDLLNELASTHDAVFNLVGIRADETERTGYQPCGEFSHKIETLMPLKDEGFDEKKVVDLVRLSVGMPSYYKWRTRSGCYFCPWQRKSEWLNLYDNHPDLFKKAMEFEKEGYTWIKDLSLGELYLKRDEIRAKSSTRDNSTSQSCTYCAR